MKHAPDIEKDDDSLGEAFFTKERIIQKSLDITLSDEVLDFPCYIKLLEVLRDRPEKITEINLYLANKGGQFDGGKPIFNALKTSDIPVNVHVVGDCYSMGSILALAGHTLTLHHGSTLMFHNYSGINVGKGKELVDAVREGDDNAWRWLNEVFQPFFTAKEVHALHHDQDLYIHWDDKDLPKRIKRHFK